MAEGRERSERNPLSISWRVWIGAAALIGIWHAADWAGHTIHWYVMEIVLRRIG